MEFICDVNGRHPNTSKVFKTFDWLEGTDVTSTCVFIRVCVYYQIWIKKIALVATPIYYLLRKNTSFIWGEEQAKAMDLFQLALTTPPALVSLD